MDSEENKISFFLMTQKGFDVLNSFLKKFDPKHISYVVGSKDENVMNDYYLDIKNLCIQNDIRFVDRKPPIEILSKYSIAISWKWLIKDKNNIIILHDSLLPKYRGFAPLVSALINQESEIGITAIFANDEFDKGEIIEQKRVRISYPIKIKKAIDLISLKYVETVLEISRKIIAGEELRSYVQDESQASYSLWRDEQDYAIDWNKDSDYIKRFIDSVSFPFLGASSKLNNDPIRIFDAKVENDVVVENRTPGKVLFVIDGYPVVVCGKGLLRIVEANSETNKSSILPLKKFRSRFN